MVFWQFVRLCFSISVDSTFAILKLEPSNMIVGAIALALGFFVFWWKRGKREAHKKLWEDFLWIFAPLGIIVFCVFIFNCIRSPYLVYKAEREEAEQKVQSAKAQAEAAKQKYDLAKPKLQPKIVDTMVAPAGDKGNAIVGVTGTIKNLGGPGPLDELWLDVKFDDGRILSAQIAAGGNRNTNINFGKNIQGQTMSLLGSEYWLNNRDVSIPTFGRLDGFIMGLVRNTTMEEILAKHATLVLTCSDTTGTKTSNEQRFGAGNPSANALGLNGLQKHVPKPLTPRH